MRSEDAPDWKALVGGILAAGGIRIPKSVSFPRNRRADAYGFALSLKDPCVVKPTWGTHPSVLAAAERWRSWSGPRSLEWM